MTYSIKTSILPLDMRIGGENSNCSSIKKASVDLENEIILSADCKKKEVMSVISPAYNSKIHLYKSAILKMYSSVFRF